MHKFTLRLIVSTLLCATALWGIITCFSSDAPVFAGESNIPKTITGYLRELLDE